MAQPVLGHINNNVGRLKPILKFSVFGHVAHKGLNAEKARSR